MSEVALYLNHETVHVYVRIKEFWRCDFLKRAVFKNGGQTFPQVFFVIKQQRVGVFSRPTRKKLANRSLTVQCKGRGRRVRGGAGGQRWMDVNEELK